MFTNKYTVAVLKKKTKFIKKNVFKGGYSEENLLMMKAKINFFAKEVGDHPNIISFLGAVVDSDACKDQRLYIPDVDLKKDLSH